MSIREDAHALRDELVGLRRELHRIPETGLDLPKTQARVLEALDGLGLEVTTGSGLSSVTAVLRGGKPGPNVLLRGDMDALPVTENTGEPFSSEHEGAMHACGHDLHTAGLVGAARLLVARKDELPGNVVFMFQPGEEGWDGASVMLEEGVLDAAGERVVGAYGLHVFSSPLPAGVFAGRPGSMMAASDSLFVTVRGAGGHGSTPYNTLDPIPAACEMVTALQTAVTRKFDIFDPVVVTVGTFHAGTRRNVIPATATFEATIRSFSPEAREKVGAEVLRVCEGVASAHGLEVDARCDREYPVTVNDAAESDFVADTVRETFGEQRYYPMPDPVAGSEDFSHVLDEVPGAYVFLGAAVGDDPRTAPYNHSAEARFDDSVLPDAATLLTECALRRLNR